VNDADRRSGNGNLDNSSVKDDVSTEGRFMRNNSPKAQGMNFNRNKNNLTKYNHGYANGAKREIPSGAGKQNFPNEIQAQESGVIFSQPKSWLRMLKS
jgi:hypothetical protein